MGGVAVVALRWRGDGLQVLDETAIRCFSNLLGSFLNLLGLFLGGGLKWLAGLSAVVIKFSRYLGLGGFSGILGSYVASLSNLLSTTASLGLTVCRTLSASLGLGAVLAVSMDSLGLRNLFQGVSCIWSFSMKERACSV